MRSADRFWLFAIAISCIVDVAIAAPADPTPAYGKVDTFEPGKKYSCVPTADHKNWDCTQTGVVKNGEKPAASHTQPSPTAPSTPAPPPAVAPPAVTASHASEQSSAPATQSAHASELPSYLSAAAATGGAPQPAPIISPPPKVPAAVVKEKVSTNPQTEVTPLPAAAKTSTPSVESKPASAMPAPKPQVAAPAPKPAPAPSVKSQPVAPVASQPAAAHSSNTSATGGFLALPGDQYVIELAHGEHQSDIAAAHAAAHVPHGEVYELHLRQNGADLWLLVWGSFADVGAARSARAELSTNAAMTIPGYPRRIAPLQAEAQRAEH